MPQLQRLQDAEAVVHAGLLGGEHARHRVHLHHPGRHDYPATHTPVEGEEGQAIFLAGQADAPGWYMTVFESCG